MMMPQGAPPTQQPFFQPVGGQQTAQPVDPNPLADALANIDIYRAYVDQMAKWAGPDSDWAKEAARLRQAEETRKQGQN